MLIQDCIRIVGWFPLRVEPSAVRQAVTFTRGDHDFAAGLCGSCEVEDHWRLTHARPSEGKRIGPKELAREYNISYDLVRQWRVEPEFKGLVEKNQQRFTDRFVRQLQAKCDEARKQGGQPDEKKLGLSDLHLYGPGLVEGIIGRIETITATSDIPTVAFWFYILSLITSPIMRRADPKYMYKLVSMCTILALQMLKALLKKDPVAGADLANVIIEHISGFERLKLQAA